MRNRLAREDGIALVLALLIMTVLTVSMGTAIYYSQASSGEARNTKQTESAYDAAQAGLSAAIAVIENPNNNLNNASLFIPRPRGSVSRRINQRL